MIEFSLELRLLFVILSVYRISELITVDDGPMMIFKRFREFLGKNSAKDRESLVKKSMADLFVCPFCIGVWISIVLGFLVLFPSIYGDIFILFVGIAGAQTFMESMTKRFME